MYKIRQGQQQARSERAIENIYRVTVWGSVATVKELYAVDLLMVQLLVQPPENDESKRRQFLDYGIQRFKTWYQEQRRKKLIVSKLEGVIFIFIWLAAVGFLIIGAYSHVRLMRHIRPKHWLVSSFWLHYGVYSKVKKYVSPQGMPYLRQFGWSLIVFLGIILCGFLYFGVFYLTR